MFRREVGVGIYDDAYVQGSGSACAPSSPLVSRARSWVATIADEAIQSARDLFALVNNDRSRLLALERASIPAMRLFQLLPRNPIVTVASAMKLIDTSKPTATKAIEILLEQDILTETTGRKRDRSFAYTAYLSNLREGTDLDGAR